MVDLRLYLLVPRLRTVQIRKVVGLRHQSSMGNWGVDVKVFSGGLKGAHHLKLAREGNRVVRTRCLKLWLFVDDNLLLILIVLMIVHRISS